MLIVRNNKNKKSNERSCRQIIALIGLIVRIKSAFVYIE